MMKKILYVFCALSIFAHQVCVAEDGASAPGGDIKNLKLVIGNVAGVGKTAIEGIKKILEFSKGVPGDIPAIKKAIEESLDKKLSDIARIQKGLDATEKLLPIFSKMLGSQGVTDPILQLVDDIGTKLVAPTKPEEAKKIAEAVTVTRTVTKELSTVIAQINKDVIPALRDLTQSIDDMLKQLGDLGK